VSARAVRFPLFDSLRAIAALAIVGTHAAFFAGAYGDGSAVAPYAARLEVGVTVFFLISGFLLYRPFVASRIAGEHAPAAGPYAWRRFLRIVPAYWVALTITVLWIGTDGVFTGSGIPTFYGLAQSYRESTISGGITQAWSLTVELAFYAFLPLYAALMRRLPARDERGRFRTEAIGLVAIAAVAVVWKVAFLAGGDPDKVKITPGLIALPAYLDQFALGMGMAVLSVWVARRGELPRWLSPLDRFPGIAWGAALVACWAVSTRVGLDGRFFEPFSRLQYLERHWLFALVGLGLILPAVFGDQSRGAVRRVLANRVLLWIGLVSYELYLWHTAALAQLAEWHSGAAEIIHSYAWWLAGGVAFGLALAAASYYLVERPILRLKRLFGEPGTAPDQPGAASAPATPSAAPAVVD
jgi:peptidoglycan/LPS O-acetylase OafA/YrhL